MSSHWEPRKIAVNGNFMCHTECKWALQILPGPSISVSDSRKARAQWPQAAGSWYYCGCITRAGWNKPDLHWHFKIAESIVIVYRTSWDGKFVWLFKLKRWEDWKALFWSCPARGWFREWKGKEKKVIHKIGFQGNWVHKLVFFPLCSASYFYQTSHLFY